MTLDELRAITNYLKERVCIEQTQETDSPNKIAFKTPTEEEMKNAGLNEEGVRQILGVDWWEEMVTDIVETPDMCDPDDSPQQILDYAKDVITEYFGKRFPRNEK